MSTIRRLTACAGCPRSGSSDVCEVAGEITLLCPGPKPMRGLGDAVRRVTDKLGIPHCSGCSKRQELLNRILPFKPEE